MFTPDWSNPVVAAVGRGAQAEMTGDREAARAFYHEAWNTAKDDLERCIAAHFVPRMIDDPRDKLRWNEDALRYATAVGDGRTIGFFASLHASVGQARLGLGDTSGAPGGPSPGRNEFGVSAGWSLQERAHRSDPRLEAGLSLRQNGKLAISGLTRA